MDAPEIGRNLNGSSGLGVFLRRMRKRGTGKNLVNPSTVIPLSTAQSGLIRKKTGISTEEIKSGSLGILNDLLSDLIIINTRRTTEMIPAVHS